MLAQHTGLWICLFIPFCFSFSQRKRRDPEKNDPVGSTFQQAIQYLSKHCSPTRDNCRSSPVITIIQRLVRTIANAEELRDELINSGVSKTVNVYIFEHLPLKEQVRIKLWTVMWIFFQHQVWPQWWGANSCLLIQGKLVTNEQEREHSMFLPLQVEPDCSQNKTNNYANGSRFTPVQILSVFCFFFFFCRYRSSCARICLLGFTVLVWNGFTSCRRAKRCWSWRGLITTGHSSARVSPIHTGKQRATRCKQMEPDAILLLVASCVASCVQCGQCCCNNGLFTCFASRIASGVHGALVAWLQLTGKFSHACYAYIIWSNGTNQPRKHLTLQTVHQCRCIFVAPSPT